MSDFETRLAEARFQGACKASTERWPTQESPLIADVFYAGFDAAATIAREVVAEKDAEIARLKTSLRFLNAECLCGAVTALNEKT